jgi:hypothetical protein
MSTQKFHRTRSGALYLGMALAFSSLAMSGCDEGNGFALSLQPFYAPTDLDVDQGLSGSWTTPEGDVTFSFEPAEGKAYKVTVKEREGEGEKSAEFEGHLMHLGAYSFVDFFPNGTSAETEFYQMHLLRAHSIARIDLSSDTLQMAFLDGTWLRKKTDEKIVDVPCQKTDGMLLLTGTTAEVQDLLFMHANDSEAFPDPIILSRQFRQEEEQ